MSVNGKRLRVSARYYCVVSAVLVCSPLHAVELIQNGSFEADGRFVVASTGWADGAGLGNDKGFATLPYPIDDEPRIWPAIPAGAGYIYGKSWGAANGDGHRGSATQFVDLSAFTGKPFIFSAWLASHPSPDDRDYAIITLEFFNAAFASGESLGSIVFDGDDQESLFIVGSANADGLPDPSIPATQDNWTFYRAPGIIPIDAVSASVEIRGAVPAGVLGFGNDGYVDFVSLQVIPEPSTVLLLAGVGPLLVVWRLARLRRGRVRVGGPSA